MVSGEIHKHMRNYIVFTTYFLEKCNLHWINLAEPGILWIGLWWRWSAHTFFFLLFNFRIIVWLFALLLAIAWTFTPFFTLYIFLSFAPIVWAISNIHCICFPSPMRRFPFICISFLWFLLLLMWSGSLVLAMFRVHLWVVQLSVFLHATIGHCWMVGLSWSVCQHNTKFLLVQTIRPTTTHLCLAHPLVDPHLPLICATFSLSFMLNLCFAWTYYNV